MTQTQRLGTWIPNIRSAANITNANISCAENVFQWLLNPVIRSDT
jgi:hypothetical protein